MILQELLYTHLPQLLLFVEKSRGFLAGQTTLAAELLRLQRVVKASTIVSGVFAKVRTALRIERRGFFTLRLKLSALA